jgi:hypothetical protein
MVLDDLSAPNSLVADRDSGEEFPQLVDNDFEFDESGADNGSGGDGRLSYAFHQLY